MSRPRVLTTVPQTPYTYGFVRDLDAAVRRHFLNVAYALAEPEIQPHAMKDYFPQSNGSRDTRERNHSRIASVEAKVDHTRVIEFAHHKRESCSVRAYHTSAAIAFKQGESSEFRVPQIFTQNGRAQHALKERIANSRTLVKCIIRPLGQF